MFERLRHRLVFATFALVVGVAMVFSTGLWIAFELAEDNLFDVHLGKDIDSLMALYEADPALTAIPNDSFTVHVAPNGSVDQLPPVVAALGPDDDELFIDGREYHVETRQRGATLYYFLFDESEFESFENILFWTMTAVVLLVIIAGGWLSVAISNRVIRPLSTLSRQVATLGDDARHGIHPDALGADTDDEVGLLARTIARYHHRISALLHREREFSADVSHELRTPLMAVQGAAELLERRVADSPDLVELTARIGRGCQHMSTLTEALLFLAREPDSFRDLVEPVSMQQVVESQIAAVRETAARKGIVVNVEAVGGAATIDTVPAVANIVIGNILKNAVKYTDRDVVSVYLTPSQVVVQDYGPGIDSTTQGHLFDRFDRGTHSDGEGSGIGLALVRRFCEQYGWSVDFYSQVNEGTRIAVAF